MPDANLIDDELRAGYPRPSGAATMRARAAATAATTARRPQPHRWRLTALALAITTAAAGTAAGLEAFGAGAASPPPALIFPTATPTSSAPNPHCPRPTGTGYYDTNLSSSSGPAGTTVTVSGRLPTVGEDGTYTGRTGTTAVVVYWNLDFDRWPSITSSSPVPAVAGSPVQQIGTQNVANLCTYRTQVTIPSLPPGKYPIEVLYEGPDSSGRWGAASFAPVDFELKGS